MIIVSSGAGLIMPAGKKYLSKDKYVLVAKNRIGKIANYYSKSLCLKNVYDCAQGKWQSAPLNYQSRRSRHCYHPPKRFSTVYAFMDTEEEAIRVAEVIQGSKIGTNDFRLKLALVSDQIISLEAL